MKDIERVQKQRLFKAVESPMITDIPGPRRVGKTTLMQHFLVQFNTDKMHEREKIKSDQLENFADSSTKCNTMEK